MNRDLATKLEEQIQDTGPIPFDQFVERALYDLDQGFYAVHGQAGGRRGDFVTSVEVGPLFAAVIADWLDSVWRQAGEPADFRVAEAGAGVGTLFRGINRAAPACFEALTYTLVERSASMRVAHQSLPTETWRSSNELPSSQQHVILANELLDNLAFGIAHRVASGWGRILVDAEQGELVLRPSERDRALDYLTELARDAAQGSCVPIASAAATWVDAARSNCDRLLAFDYGAPTAELAERPDMGWLRTYAGHQRGGDPLYAVGACDITHDVPIDQLPQPVSVTSQAEWLRHQGLEDRVEAARQIWQERAHIGDLQAMAARSAIGEAEALTDPSGLGSFLVMEWRG